MTGRDDGVDPAPVADPDSGADADAGSNPNPNPNPNPDATAASTSAPGPDAGGRGATAATTARAGDPPTVAVVGAGAVGLATALDLAGRGARVTVYERGRVGDGTGSSARAAGVCYDAYAEDVDAAVGRRALALFRAAPGADVEPADVDPPVGAAPTHVAGPGTAPGTGTDEVTAPGVGTAARDDADPSAVAFRECPYAIVVREGDDATAEALGASVDRMRAHGVDVASVAPADLPAPVRTDDVAAAALARGAGYLDPAGYVTFLAARARAAGVEVREECPVAVETGAGAVDPAVRPVDGGEGEGDDAGETDPVDAVVVAAGAHSRDLLADAGVAVPVAPYRVQALVSATAYDGPMAFDATTETYCRPHPTGLLAGDGTVPVAADPDDWDRGADDAFVDAVVDDLRHRLGHEADVVDAWAGLCTATPDGDPLVGAAAPGTYVAAGWQGHGLMRAPAIGEALGRAILGDEAVPAPFDPGRFDGDEPVTITQGMTVE